jgi:hypothetical protein
MLIDLRCGFNEVVLRMMQMKETMIEKADDRIYYNNCKILFVYRDTLIQGVS